MASLKTSILRTLIYADIFDFPLTSEEIHKFLIQRLQGESRRPPVFEKTEGIAQPRMKHFSTLRKDSINSRPVSLAKVKKALVDLLADKKVGQVSDLYFLTGRKKIVVTRKGRERWSRKKLTIVQRAAQWLKLMPTIKMVAVTGALAINNAKKEDDIDLLIVAAKNRLWLTRLLTVLLVEVVAQRRRPQDKQAKDKLCLNMFLEENHLKVPQANQDLFTAHEIVQLRPLWSRDNTFEKFLSQNQWAERFLPNATKIQGNKATRQQRKKPIKLLSLFEKLAYHLQLAYMKPRQTIEIVQLHRIHFRCHDHRDKILTEYQKRLRQRRIGQ